MVGLCKSTISRFNDKDYLSFVDLPSDTDLNGSRSIGVLLLWLLPQAKATYVGEPVAWVVAERLFKNAYIYKDVLSNFPFRHRLAY